MVEVTDSTVLNVGYGIFILAFVWAFSLLVCVTFARSPTSISNIGPLAIFGAAVVTLILVLIPREGKDPSAEEQSVVYDYSIVYRSSLIGVMALFVLVGAAIYLVQHMMAPIYAKPLRKFVR